MQAFALHDGRWNSKDNSTFQIYSARSGGRVAAAARAEKVKAAAQRRPAAEPSSFAEVAARTAPVLCADLRTTYCVRFLILRFDRPISHRRYGVSITMILKQIVATFLRRPDIRLVAAGGLARLSSFLD